jgi:hypothetical protein
MSSAVNMNRGVVREQVDVYNTTVIPNMPSRRMSWGAIVAGAIIALVSMFALYMMGLAIGAATINPLTEADPVEPAVATGTVIWLAASTLIGLFLGGLVAGRMGGLVDEVDGALHGLVTWGVVTVVTLLMITSTIGSLVNGLTSALGTIVSTTGQVAAEAAPEVAQALNVQASALQSIQDEVRGMIASANAPAPVEGQPAQPLNLQDSPLTLEQIQLNRQIAGFLAADPNTITDADRDALAAAIAERTGQTPQAAREMVNNWETVYMEIRTEAELLARRAAQTATDITTLLAGAAFAMMVAGAFAAGAGGYIGTDAPRRTETTIVTEQAANPVRATATVS